MRRLRADVRALALGGSAAAGVLVAHWLGYRLAVPDHVHRGEVLHATGHRYWGYFVAIAIGLLFAGLSSLISRRARSGVTGGGARTFRYALTRLLPLGVCLFVGLEGAERLFFAPEHDAGLFLTQAPVLIGIAFQAVVALIGALVLTLVTLVVDAVVARTAPKLQEPRQPLPRRNFARALTNLLLSCGCGVRGPPVVAF